MRSEDSRPGHRRRVAFIQNFATRSRMTEKDRARFNRRDLARSAVIGGTSLLFGTVANANIELPGNREFIDVRKLGAAGDGKTDDTRVLQRALDAAAEKSGAVFVPPGVYLTQKLHVRAGIALVGVPAWNYSGPGGT